MSWPQSVKDKCMIACGRSCCICHKPCGVKMEIHHIDPKAKGGVNTFENAIPVCFDCHAEIGHYSPSHPKGTSFSPAELKAHRNNWYEKVRDTGASTASRTLSVIDTRIFTSIHDEFAEPYLYFKDSVVWPSIPYDLIGKLDRLNYRLRLNAPDMQFLDANLEQLKVEFWLELREFCVELSRIGTTDGPKDHMILRIKPYVSVTQEQYDYMLKQSKYCDELIDGCIEAYESFYKAARLALGLDLIF